MTTTINFNDLDTGTKVTDQFTTQGVTISASGGSGDAMIFDTDLPTGGDTDLATDNLGKVLIVSEDGRSGDPDDNGNGGTFTFDFDTNATVKALTFLDIEETATITLLATDGSVIETIHVGATGDNGQVVVDIDVAGVASMEVALAGSGAIDDLTFVAGPAPDFIVEGTSQGELIDGDYTGDPEGDLVDALDNNDTPANNDDLILAGGGNDTVKAGDGDDTVFAGEGDDFVLGDDNNDQAGDDLLLGEDGDDTLCGLDGDDTLDGGAGEDYLEGMDGDDLILGGSGNDKAFGDEGDDTIYGDQSQSGTLVGDNLIVNGSFEIGQEDGTFGQADNQPGWYNSFDPNNHVETWGEGFQDEVAAEGSNFVEIDVERGRDELAQDITTEDGQEYELKFSLQQRIEGSDDAVEVYFGGVLVDTIIPGDDWAEYTYTVNGSGSDTLQFREPVGQNNTYGPLIDDVSLFARSYDVEGGDDTLLGGSGDDLIYGEGGDDSINGQTGDDTLEGGDGDDFITGSHGEDVITGGDGDDTAKGGADDDLIYGGGGDDSLQGNGGDDTIYGDAPDEGTPTGDNLIVNGSFEIGQEDGTFDQADNQPGWYNGFDPNNHVETWGEGFEGETAAEGSNFVELDVERGRDELAQDVTTEDGQDYKLTFSLQQRVEGSEDAVEVYFGGVLVDTIVPGDDWTEYTYNVVGSGSDTLQFREPVGQNNTFGPLIDDVSLYAVTFDGDEAGNDTILGGSGDDVIFGNQGDDLLEGGAGADTMSGGDDRDTFVGGTDGDAVDGGTGSTAGLDEDDFDVLDLTGEGPFRVLDETEDADGNSTSGTIEFLNDDGTPTGATMTFTEIEEILGDRVNDGPVAEDDTGEGDEDTDITGNVLANDSDPDLGDTLQVIDNTDPANGTVTIDADGNYTYTPDENFNGDDSFTYTVTDSAGNEATATVNLTVLPVNDDPVARDDSDTTDFETVVSVNLLANDDDVDGDDPFVTSASVDPAEGSLVETAPGVYDFTPADGFEGTATISYTISDGNGGTDSAVHTVEVGADPTPQDGIVDGEETGEEMVLDYDDSNLPTDQGGDIVTNDDDVIEGNGGDDTIDGAGGDDTISGGDDDDSITGGDGDDSVNGDDGSDTLAGGEGDDTLNGGAGDDDIAVGGNDVADGGTGDDVFTVDATDPDAPTDVTIDGGSDGTDGNPDGPENGDEGDVLDLSDQTDDLTVDFDPNPEEGTVNGLDTDDDDPADITFEEIEKVITGAGDDVVTGEDATDGFDVETGDGDDDVTGGEGDDTIDAGDGDDDVEAGDGDDSVTAGDGDDDVEGGDGDDTIDGGDGSDTITGGDGADEIDGGDGDDDIEVGAGDTAEGGIGDDVFTVDDTLDGDSPISVDGGSDGTQPGDEAGPENGDEGDVLDLRGLDLVSLEFDPTDPESGTAVYNNEAGDPVTLTFTEIETVLHDPLPDGIVDGEETGEDMGPNYDDGLQATDNGGDIIDGPDGDDDVINGNGGDDTINAGQGSDTVSGGSGDDSITGGASEDADVIDGDEGNDTIFGEGGDDTLDGGSGDDVIEGGTGNDEITGGDGSDSVEGGQGNDVIDTSGSAPATDLDTPNIPPFITGGPGDTDTDDDKDTVDGGAGDDTITTGDDADVIDGGQGNDVIDAGIDADTINGGDGNDEIVGGEGSDSILGGDGEDTIYGGLDSTAPDVLNVTDDGFDSPIGPDPVDNNGDDYIDAGAGDDVVFGQDDNDTILGGTGNDTIDGGVDDDSLLGGQGEDEIEGGHGQDFIQGNQGDDTISGGRGSDTLEGNAGDDSIIGGAGDSIIGGGGADTIIIEQDEVDEDGDNDTAIFVDGSSNGDDNDTLDLTDFVAYRNLVETVDGDGDSTSGTVEVQNDDDEWVTVTFGEIEDLLLPAKAPDLVVDGEEFGEVMNPLYDDADGPTDGGGDIIDGPDGDDDSIRGNGGDDTINAGAGDDTVDGGDDDDQVLGGSGDDIVMGGEGDDTVRGQIGDDTVSGGAGNDSVTGASGDDVLDGGSGDDSLTGGSGNDTIDGGLGDDSITGSTGADSITDMDGDNLINSDNPGSFNPDLGVPIGSTGGGFVVVAPDTDPDDNKDTVTTGSGDDTINTGDDADVIDAGNGDNVIDAGTDADTITTGDGDDSITGGEGDDLINSGDGDDTIDGGVGDPLANLIDEPNDGFFGDPILNNGDDTINAGAGNDVVNGEDDNDVIDGGSGDDTLDGGIDDDTVLGGEGDDVIIGGQGADSLDGGFGYDVFNVGTFTDPNGTGDYQEGVGDTIVGGEDADDGDIDTLDLTGSGSLKVVYDDSVDPTGTPGESGTVIFYTDASQTEVSGTLTFKEIENVIPCFTPGTMIATPRGEVPVETLREGDKVITRDNGIQEIRWSGNRTLNRTELAEGENLKPILIKAGSLGRNLPERDLLVSPQHRVLITGETPQLYFEESEVLVAAKHLVGKQGVSVMDTMRTTYIHFMFDRHEVVLSDGAWTESFQPGDQSLGSMGEATREEIFALFPELATQGGLTDYAAARRSLKAHEAKLLRL